MKRPFRPLVVGLIASALLVIVSVVTSGVVSETQSRLIGSILMVAAGTTVAVVKRKEERRTGSRAEGSHLRILADRAQSLVLRDALVVGVLFGVGALFLPSVPAAVPVLALVVFMTGDFWLRYGLLVRAAPESTRRTPS